MLHQEYGPKQVGSTPLAWVYSYLIAVALKFQDDADDSVSGSGSGVDAKQAVSRQHV